jgi:hypothetical protein
MEEKENADAPEEDQSSQPEEPSNESSAQES